MKKRVEYIDMWINLIKVWSMQIEQIDPFKGELWNRRSRLDSGHLQRQLIDKFCNLFGMCRCYLFKWSFHSLQQLKEDWHDHICTAHSLQNKRLCLLLTDSRSKLCKSKSNDWALWMRCLSSKHEEMYLARLHSWTFIAPAAISKSSCSWVFR